MKKVLLFFICLSTISSSFGQINEPCIPQYPDSTTVVNLPWYGNNQFLNTYLINNGYYNGNPQARTNSCAERFTIPLNLWIYRNNINDASSSITSVRAFEIIRRLNEYHINAGTRIRFVVKSIVFEAKENYRTGLTSIVQIRSHVCFQRPYLWQ